MSGSLRGSPGAGALRAAAVAMFALLLAPPEAPGLEIGVNTINGRFDSAQAVEFVGEARNEAARMRRGGARIVRTQFSWRRVARKPGKPFNWGYYDPIVDAAARGGLDLVPVIAGTPPWAAHANQGWPVDAAGLAHYATFVEAVAARYGRGGSFWRSRPGIPYTPITAYQIWNEQNRPDMAPNGGRAPHKYARLLEVSRRAVDTIDPRARIVLGGMTELRRSKFSAHRFLTRLYEVRGARSNFDVVDVHPYAGRAGAAVDVVERFRESLRRLGDPRRPLWVGEIGWGTNGPAGHRLVTSEVRQAELLRTSFRAIRARARDWRVRKLLWFSWRDAAPPDRTRHWDLHAGLFERDGRPKPAWDAFRRAALGG